jgi:hypothetical protein
MARHLHDFSRPLETDVHRIQLSDSFLAQLIYGSKVGLHLTQKSEGEAENLADAFPRTTVRVDSLEDLTQKCQSFTMLDTCSLYDAIIERGPVRDTRDL